MAQNKRRRGGRTTPKGTRPGHRPEPQSVARLLVREADDLLRGEATLGDLEVWASGSALMMRPRGFDPAPLVPPREAIREARRHGGAAGCLLAKALWVYGPEEYRAEGRELADRLGETLDPEQAAVVGRLGLVEVGAVWLMGDVWRDGGTLILECADAAGATTGVGAKIDPIHGLAAVDFLFEVRLDELRRLVDEDPHTELLEVDAADAAETMRLALTERASLFEPPEVDDAGIDLEALVAQRFGLLPGGGEPLFPLYERDDELRELCIDSFLSMNGVADLPDAADIAGTICDFADSCDGDVLCWSPARVAYFLEEWLPHKVVADDPWFRAVAPVMREWVLYAATVRKLSPAAVAILLDCVDQSMGLMQENRHDRSRRSAGANIVAEMQADGVDMLDKRAVDAWIARYNERPRDQRW